MNITAVAVGMGVELHISGRGHALLGVVDLLEASVEVVPELVQVYMLQSLGILTPV